MTAPNLSRRSLASYDAAGTTIRLAYDPEPGRNLLDDPEYVHELGHYGQNLTTRLGVEQTLMAHELFAATNRILREAPRLRLPLSACRGEQSDVPCWESADVPLAFRSRVLGGARQDLFERYDGVVEELRSNVVAATYRPAASNPFYLQFRSPLGPGFGLRCRDGSRAFFPIDGDFVLEVHARSSAFIARWAHVGLTIDEAVQYFLYSQNNPYTMLYLAVSKMLTERLGKGVFDVQDAVFVCHLCAQIALDVTEPGLADLPVMQVHCRSARYDYVSPGYAFLLALAAAVDQFIRPGWAVNRYFELMAAILTKRGWPSFETLTASIRSWVDELVDAVSADAAESPYPYTAGLLAKLRDSGTAVSWLLVRYREGDVMSFIRAPALMINSGLIGGPLILGPSRLSRLTSIDQPGLRHVDPSKEQVAGLLIAFLTEKLWRSAELTCLDGDSASPADSIFGCPRTSNCAYVRTTLGRRWVCANPMWTTLLQRYPGLWARLPELAGISLASRAP